MAEQGDNYLRQDNDGNGSNLHSYPGAQASNPSNSLYDPVDRRIMELLQRDGRLSNSEVARSLGLSEPTVRRRISRLIETGILRIVGVINPEAVGYTISAVIGVNSALQQLDEVAKTIASFSEIRYLGYSTGSFDFIIEGFFYSHQHLLDFLRTKLGAFSCHLTLN